MQHDNFISVDREMITAEGSFSYGYAKKEERRKE